MKPGETADLDADEFLERIGFDQDETVLTHRQAEILVLRQRGIPQATIADHLGTSRANVANIEASAKENIQKAHGTVRFIEAMRAPVRVPVQPGTDIYDIPDTVYEACDSEDIDVAYSAPELMKRVLDSAEDVIHGRTIEAPLTISVNRDGAIQVRHRNPDDERDETRSN